MARVVREVEQPHHVRPSVVVAVAEHGQTQLGQIAEQTLDQHRNGRLDVRYETRLRLCRVQRNDHLQQVAGQLVPPVVDINDARVSDTRIAE